MSTVSNARIGFPQWLPRWKSKHSKVQEQGIGPTHCLVFFTFCAHRLWLHPSEKVISEGRLHKHFLKNGACLLFLESISVEEIKFSRG